MNKPSFDRKKPRGLTKKVLVREIAKLKALGMKDKHIGDVFGYSSSEIREIQEGVKFNERD